VESAGFHDGNACSFTVDSTVTECPTSADDGRGFNLLVLDAEDCSTVDQQRFDTWNNAAASAAMQEYVEGLAPGALVLVAVKDATSTSAQPELTAELRAAMADAFGTQELANLGWRESYAAILVKDCPPPLDEERKAVNAGPASAHFEAPSTAAARYRLKLAASDAAAKDNFGFSVAVEGDTVVVGADQEDNGGPGAAYVLRASDGAQLAKLTAADGAAGDRFGVSVAIEDDTVVAGAIKASTGGAAYVFQLSSSYEVETYSADCTEPGTFTYEGRTLHCIELPSGELVDALEVDGGAQTCKYTDTNSCPAGYDIWVPRSYAHAAAVVDAVEDKFTNLLGVYREENGCGGCALEAMNSDA
jgi:hypothetical protein